MEQPPQDRAGGGERRVGDDVERPAGQAEIAGVGTHERDAPAELGGEAVGTPAMTFDGDHGRAGVEEWSGDRAVSGADVDDEVAAADPGGRDEAFSPDRVE